MTKDTTVGEIFSLYNGIVTCDDLSTPNGVFTSKLSIAFMVIEPIVKAVEKSRPKKSKRVEEYDSKRQEILFKFASLKDDGSIKVEGTNVAIAKPIEYNAAIKELDKEYESDLDDYKEKTETWSTIFDKSVHEEFNKDLTLPIVKKVDLPKDIKVKELRGIVLLLDKDIDK